MKFSLPLTPLHLRISSKISQIWHLSWILCPLVLISWQANAKPINGSIHFQDEKFHVLTRTFSDELKLTKQGCAIFSLSVVSASEDARVLLLDQSGNERGVFEYDQRMKSRNCEADLYEIVLDFDRPRTIHWTPVVDRSRGYADVEYKASVSPKQIRFSPPIDLIVHYKNADPNTGMRRTGISTLSLEGDINLIYGSGGMNFLTSGGVISRSGGFTNDDKFLVASDFRPLPAPEAGSGSEIRFDSLPDEPTRFSLYYPSGGPHMLTFFGDREQQTPTTVGDFQIDGKGLLNPEIVILQNPSLLVERGPLHFLSSRDRVVSGELELSFGGSGLYIRGVSVISSDGSAIDFQDNLLKNLVDPEAEQTEAEILRQIIPESVSRGPIDALSSFGSVRAIDVVRIEELDQKNINNEEALAILRRKKYAPVLEYPILSTGTPLRLKVRARVPGVWDPGQRSVNVSVRTASGYERILPIELNIADPYSLARTTLTGVLGALLTAALIWLVVERRKLAYQKESDLDNKRMEFFKDNYSEYIAFRGQITALLRATPAWSDVEELLREFVDKRLQTVLTTEDWDMLRSLWERKMAHDVLALLHRAAWIERSRDQ